VDDGLTEDPKPDQVEATEKAHRDEEVRSTGLEHSVEQPTDNKVEDGRKGKKGGSSPSVLHPQIWGGDVNSSALEPGSPDARSSEVP